MQDLFTGLERMYQRTIGGSAPSGMVAGFAIIEARDPYGIRPLAVRFRPHKDGKGLDYMLASESMALVLLG